MLGTVKVGTWKEGDRKGMRDEYFLKSNIPKKLKDFIDSSWTPPAVKGR
jgi:hypothetical protein